MSWEASLPEEATIRFEVQNSKPVDLFDLTSALSAFGEAYQDHLIQSGVDLDKDHLRLYVKEIRAGSIITDLISLAPQVSFIIDHIDVAVGFVTHLNEVMHFLPSSAGHDEKGCAGSYKKRSGPDREDSRASCKRRGIAIDLPRWPRRPCSQLPFQSTTNQCYSKLCSSLSRAADTQHRNAAGRATPLVSDARRSGRQSRGSRGDRHNFAEPKETNVRKRGCEEEDSRARR
jgi:hypothetical protein